MTAQTTNNETETKGGYTLAMVPFLDGADDWLDFSDGIETFLIMNNQLDWLDSHPNKPNGSSQEKEWKRRHKYAIYAIRARSNYNAKQMIYGIESYQDAFRELERNYKPQGDGTFRVLSDQFFATALAEYKNVEEYTKAVKRLANQLAKLGVTIPEPLVILRYLQGLGSAYSVFYTSFTTNNQILPGGEDDGESGVTFDFVALKTKGYEKTLAQEDISTALTATRTISSPTIANDTTPAAGGDTRNIEVPWCTHCSKSYHTKDQCWILHPHLKRRSKAGKGRHGPPNKRRRRGDDDDDDGPISLIAHFGMTANNDVDNIIHTQWAIDTACSRHITHSREHFINYEVILESSTHIKGLGGTSCTAIGRGTVKVRCKIKGKSRSIHISNVYHVPDCAVNLISVAQLFKLGADVRFTSEHCKIKSKDKVLTGTGKNGCWFLDTTLE